MTMMILMILIRRLQMTELMGEVSIATVDRTIKQPDFPKPILLGSGTKRPLRVWDRDEVEAWLRSRKRSTAVPDASAAT
jgi:predicted DNA-binding transcriptional regulator AlpA